MGLNKESITTLSELAGVTEEEAIKLLKLKVLITTEKHSLGINIGREVQHALSKTIDGATLNIDSKVSYDYEVLIGSVKKRSSGKSVYASVLEEDFVVSFKSAGVIKREKLHGVLQLIAALYICSFVLGKAFGKHLGVSTKEDIKLNYLSIIGVDRNKVYENEVKIPENTYLVGVGGIGSSFIYAAKHFNLGGNINIIDNGFVSAGTLRCPYYEYEDIGREKVNVLKEKVQSQFPNVDIVSIDKDFLKYDAKENLSLNHLIVAIDTKPDRRKFQERLPLNVYDSSTSGVSDIVLHTHHSVGTSACLSCIYRETEKEISENQTIASHLGITMEDIIGRYVNEETAEKILLKYPKLKKNDLIGKAYNSLYKKLCGTGELAVDGGSPVIAPFTFVSMLAGAFLAVDFIRRITYIPTEYNDFHINPWLSPQFSIRKIKPQYDSCEFCSKDEYIEMFNEVWYNK